MTAIDLRGLSEEERDRLARATTPRVTHYIPVVPTPKQAAFMLLPHREAFFGGGAGPGKSVGLLASALQYVDVPGYHALILRRTLKQLSMPNSLMHKSHEWLGRTDARWAGGPSVINGELVPARSWVFPSGATLTFGHLGVDRESRRQYESAEFNYVGVDELTGFDEDEYRFMFSRLRRAAGYPVPSRMRSASNPGGRGHEWVKRRFVNARTRLRRAPFIPATIDDNPHLDRAEYVLNLQELHPTTWRRLLAGDWEIGDAGELFQPRLWLTDEDFLDEAPDPSERVPGRFVRYWDLAAAEPTEANPDPDWTAGCRMSRLKSGLYCWEHVVRVRRTPAQTEKVLHATASTDGRRCTQWFEQVPGAGAHLAHHLKTGDVFPERVIVKADTSHSGKAKGVRARPLAAAMEKHRVRFVRGPWNEPLFDEQEAFSEDPNVSGAHDDQVDGGSGAFSKVSRRPGSGGVTGAQPAGSIPR